MCRYAAGDQRFWDDEDDLSMCADAAGSLAVGVYTILIQFTRTLERIK